jgi:DNA mismatch repair ATPase MutL
MATLLEAHAQRKTGTLDFDESAEESVSSISSKSPSVEEAVGEASSQGERLHFATGEFDPTYKLPREKLQLTNVISFEQAESALEDRGALSLGAVSEQVLTEVGISLREAEKTWLESHARELSAFAGEWLVVEGEELIAHSVDMVKAVKEARSRGVRIPYVTRLPLEKEAPFIG